MKNLHLIFILIISLTFEKNMAQEIIQGRIIIPDSSIHAKVDKWFKAYELTELDLNALNRLANSYDDLIPLQINQNRWNLKLLKNEIRSPNYISVHTNNTKRILQDKKDCITYAGYVNDNPANMIRLTISDEIIRGFIVVDQETFIFDQLRRIIKEGNKNLIILYKAKDVREKNNLLCGVINQRELDYLSQIESSTQSMKSGVSTCRILELATDADYEWYQLYGSNSNDEILAIINMIQGVYLNTFDLETVVVYQHVFTTSNDPYTANPLTDQGSSDLLNEMRVYWENNFSNIDRDLAHLFVGRESGVEEGYVGRSYWATVCADPGYEYGFSRDWAEQFTTTAHEIGHSFSGLHGDGRNCGTQSATVMCVGTKAIPLVFSTPSINRIESFMDAHSDCLLEFENMNITGSTGIVCNNQTTTYTLDSELSGNVTWSVSNSNLSIISGQGTETVTVRGKSSGNGEVILTASVPAENCNVEDTWTIWVGVPDYQYLQVRDYYTKYTNPNLCLYDDNYLEVFMSNGADDKQGVNYWGWNLVSGGYLYVPDYPYDVAIATPMSSYFSFQYRAHNTCGWSSYMNNTLNAYYCGYYYSYSPNPVSDQLKIEAVAESGKAISDFENNIPVEFDVILYNSEKQIVKQGKSENSKIMINIGDLEKGIYFLHIIDMAGNYEVIKEQIIIN
jgi:hypothetical protein